MQIIFSRKIAEELRDRYTILELETFTVQDQILETFCVVSGEKLNLAELPHLADHIRMHEEFIEQLKQKNYRFCIDAIEQLMGKFGGEIDSFYEIVLERCNKQVT
jgi:hypothetical protein